MSFLWKHNSWPIQNRLVVSCQWLWIQICQQNGCRASIKCLEDHYKMEIDWIEESTLTWKQIQIHWHIYARIHQKSTSSRKEHHKIVCNCTQCPQRSIANFQWSHPEDTTKESRDKKTWVEQAVKLTILPLIWQYCHTLGTQHTSAACQRITNGNSWLTYRLLYNFSKCRNLVWKRIQFSTFILMLLSLVHPKQKGELQDASSWDG